MFKEVIKVLQIESLRIDVKAIEPMHKFLHKSLLDGIKFYNDDQGLEYIQYFGSVIFVLSRGADRG